jgi:hypothetical protein
MASETQRQQQLINSGFLDNLGSTPDVPLELDTVEKIFVKWMGLLVEALQRNINGNGSGWAGYEQTITASGALSASVRFEYRKNGKGYTGEIYMLDYADYVDKGVKGINSSMKAPKSPYQFKSWFPSENMKKGLLLWVREKSVLTEITAPKGLFGRHTRTYLRNKDRANDLATAIGIAIKSNGLWARPFKDASVKEIMEGMKAELAQAMAHDIAININTSILR